jgi:hypothetical protein
MSEITVQVPPTIYQKFRTDLAGVLTDNSGLNQCIRKRLTKESESWELSSYVLDNYRLQDGRLSLTFIIAQRKIVIKIPEFYPFKAPVYYITVTNSPPQYLTNKISEQGQLPDEVESLTREWLVSTHEEPLKKYLYEQYHQQELPEATSIITVYGDLLSPYHWSPGLQILSQLPMVEQMLDRLR